MINVYCLFVTISRNTALGVIGKCNKTAFYHQYAHKKTTFGYISYMICILYNVGYIIYIDSVKKVTDIENCIIKIFPEG